MARPYRTCAMDSREIKVHGLIKDLQVIFAAYPEISILLDIVVVDLPNAWGMLLSRKWATNLGGTIQLDFSIGTIPTVDNTHT
jgi:hypothetical protein